MLRRCVLLGPPALLIAMLLGCGKEKPPPTPNTVATYSGGTITVEADVHPTCLEIVPP